MTEEVKKLDLFKEILPSIMRTKENILINEEDYAPWLVNYALSMHLDCLFYSNEINCLPILPLNQQYKYFMGSIKGYRRPFVPWPKKKATDEILTAVMKFFNYSRPKAEDAIKCLTTEQLKEIVELYNES